MPQVTVTEPADGVVVLTLERPEKKNALSIAVRDEMSDALDRLAKDEDVKVVIITGAGDVFLRASICASSSASTMTSSPRRSGRRRTGGTAR